MSLSHATLRHRIQHAVSVSQLAEIYSEVVDLNPESAYEEDLMLKILDLVNNRLIQLVDPIGLKPESLPDGAPAAPIRPRSGGG